MNDLSDEAERVDETPRKGEGEIKLANGIKFATIWRGVARSHEPKSGKNIQDKSSRAGDSLLDPSVPFNGKLARFEGAVREVVRPVAEPTSAMEALSDISANVQVIVQRAAPLVELQSVIQELQKLHDFLKIEGERLEGEISKYAQISKSTTIAPRAIANHILNLTSHEH
jgi:hypothetical protein